jgi:hypothetical protein
VNSAQQTGSGFELTVRPDWSRFYRIALLVIVVSFFIPATLWAMLGLEGGFRESGMERKNRDFEGHVWVYTWSMWPLVVCSLLLARLSPWRGLPTLAACIPVAASMLTFADSSQASLIDIVRMAAPLFVFGVALVVWDWTRTIPPRIQPPPADRLS